MGTSRPIFLCNTSVRLVLCGAPPGSWRVAPATAPHHRPGHNSNHGPRSDNPARRCGAGGAQANVTDPGGQADERHKHVDPRWRQINESQRGCTADSLGRRTDSSRRSSPTPRSSFPSATACFKYTYQTTGPPWRHAWRLRGTMRSGPVPLARGSPPSPIGNPVFYTPFSDSSVSISTPKTPTTWQTRLMVSDRTVNLSRPRMYTAAQCSSRMPA